MIIFIFNIFLLSYESDSYIIACLYKLVGIHYTKVTVLFHPMNHFGEGIFNPGGLPLVVFYTHQTYLANRLA